MKQSLQGCIQEFTVVSFTIFFYRVQTGFLRSSSEYQASRAEPTGLSLPVVSFVIPVLGNQCYAADSRN